MSRRNPAVPALARPSRSLSVAAVGALSLSGALAAPTNAGDEIIIRPDTVIAGAPGSVTTVATMPVPSSLAGQPCDLRIVTQNNSSIHPGTTVIVTTGQSAVVVTGVEDSSVGAVLDTSRVVLGQQIVIDVQLGPDGDSSLGFTAGFECSPESLMPGGGAASIVTSTTTGSSTTASSTTGSSTTGSSTTLVGAVGTTTTGSSITGSSTTAPSITGSSITGSSTTGAGTATSGSSTTMAGDGSSTTGGPTVSVSGVSTSNPAGDGSSTDGSSTSTTAGGSTAAGTSTTAAVLTTVAPGALTAGSSTTVAGSTTASSTTASSTTASSTTASTPASARGGANVLGSQQATSALPQAPAAKATVATPNFTG